MNLLTADNIEAFLKRFEGFDGAIVKGFEYKPNSTSDKCELAVFLRAIDASIANSSPYSGEVNLKIHIKGDVEFRMCEPGGGANVVINYEVVGYASNGKIYINFDPLHSKDWTTKDWSVEEIRNSPFYVGGRQIFWMIIYESS